MKAQRYLEVFMISSIFAAGCAKNEPAPTVTAGTLAPATLIKVRNSNSQGYFPTLSEIGPLRSKGTTGRSQTVHSFYNRPMVNFDEGFSGKEITVDLGVFDRDQDFGPNGSITLVAKTLQYPIAGDAYPVLTAFEIQTQSGTTELVKLTSGCFDNGMWNCSGSSCSANPSCKVQVQVQGQDGSVFSSRQDWDQHQVPSFGFVSVNDFPRCNPEQSGPSCLAAPLPSGHYYAKYVLLSNSGGSVASYRSGLEVQVSVKKDVEGANSTSVPVNGGLNLNLILVGDENISDSETAVGRRNLDLLLREVNRLLGESGANLALNEIQVYQWTNANGGSVYSDVEIDSIGDMFESGSKGLDSSDEGKFLNVFLVNDIKVSPWSTYSILGLSGGILGPPINGTQSSGVVFSTLRALDQFNTGPGGCDSLACDRSQQDADFLEMASTMVHEIGHYLGLNHPSEDLNASGAQDHDGLSDTPRCGAREIQFQDHPPEFYFDAKACFDDNQSQGSPLSGSTCKAGCSAVTGSSVYSTSRFCPLVQECQFNHVMWFTTKNRRIDGGEWIEDGNLISSQSSYVLQRSYFLR